MGLFGKLFGGGGGGDAEVQKLVKDLKDADWEKRFAAAKKLGEIGDRATPAMPALEEAIADENGEVCLAASDALSRIRRAAH
ncbi:MAG: HEAT repeat domain-containing protein [Planctomycetes bacterium]|nr:HEAT repeat domain-containing protein [Planctomycetota bacterium]